MSLVSANGTKLYYLQTGEGEDVVFVHGLASSLAFWFSGVLLPLRHQYRVTAYDLRGHGRSHMPLTGYTHMEMADDLFDFVERLQLQTFHLVGHSYGGLIAISFASRHLQRLLTLTLADVPVSGEKASDFRFCYPELVEQMREAGVNIGYDKPYPELQLLEELAQPQVWRQVKAATGKNSERYCGHGKGSGKTLRRWLKLLNTTTAREDFRSRAISWRDLSRIERPVLITYGSESRWKSSGDILRHYLPLSKVVHVEHAGHAHPWEKPAAFLQLWLEFVAFARGSTLRYLRERRRDRRFEVAVVLQVRKSAALTFTAETVNISRTGVLISCSCVLEVGSLLELRTVPDEGKQRFTAMGNVVRRAVEERGKSMFFGIEFSTEGQDSGPFLEFLRTMKRGQVTEGDIATTPY